MKNIKRQTPPQVKKLFIPCNSMFARREVLTAVQLYIVTYCHLLLLLLSVGLPVANAPDVLQPCGLLYYP